MLKSGMDWLHSTITSAASETVTLQFGSRTTPNVKAFVGQTLKTSVIDDKGSSIETTVTDFLILADSYVINGEPVKPSPSHRIIRTNGAVYKPTPLVGDSVWRWSTDLARSVYRIHAIEV